MFFIHQTVVHILSAFRGLADGTDISAHICRIRYMRMPLPAMCGIGLLPSLPDHIFANILQKGRRSEY